MFNSTENRDRMRRRSVVVAAAAASCLRVGGNTVKYFQVGHIRLLSPSAGQLVDLVIYAFGL